MHTNLSDTCRDLVVKNGQMSREGMREEVRSGTRTLDTFRSDVGKYLAQQQQIKALAASVDCGVVRIRLQVIHQKACRRYVACHVFFHTLRENNTT